MKIIAAMSGGVDSAVAATRAVEGVPYTHLRAPETVLDIV